jgi:hypothetical protein
LFLLGRAARGNFVLKALALREISKEGLCDDYPARPFHSFSLEAYASNWRVVIVTRAFHRKPLQHASFKTCPWAGSTGRKAQIRTKLKDWQSRGICVHFFVGKSAGALHLFDKKNRNKALGLLPAAVASFSSCFFKRRSTAKLATTVGFFSMCFLFFVCCGFFDFIGNGPVVLRREFYMGEFFHENPIHQVGWGDFLFRGLFFNLMFQGPLQPDDQLGFINVGAVRHGGKIQGAMHRSTAFSKKKAIGVKTP